MRLDCVPVLSHGGGKCFSSSLAPLGIGGDPQQGPQRLIDDGSHKHASTGHTGSGSVLVLFQEPTGAATTGAYSVVPVGTDSLD